MAGGAWIEATVLALSLAAHAGVFGAAARGARAAHEARTGDEATARVAENLIAIEATETEDEPRAAARPEPAREVAREVVRAPAPHREHARTREREATRERDATREAEASRAAASASPAASAVVTAPVATTRVEEAASAGSGAATTGAATANGAGDAGGGAHARAASGASGDGRGAGDMPGYLRALHGRMARLVEFPEAAARAAHQGVVRVRLVLLADGSLASADVVGGEADASLRAAALSAAMRARPFERPPPGVLEAGRVAIEVPLRFVLRD